MKSLKKQINPIALLLLCFALLAVSCKKNNPNAGLAPPRLFMPGGISVAASDTAAVISWTASLFSSGQKLNYTVQFSRDSMFSTVDYSKNTDSLNVNITQSTIKIRTNYYVRVKANAYQGQPESKWSAFKGFNITGEQLFYPIRPLELKETSVVLRWHITPTLTTIIFTPGTGTATTYNLTPTELSTGVKTITGIPAGTSYTAELFGGTKSTGYLTFSTPAATIYARILNPGDDLVAAVTAAANNDVIGLNPGIYTANAASFSLIQKTVTIKSTSGDPTDTKVAFKEFDLKGNGAGLNFSGIEFDGSAAGALYFVNCTGVSVDAEKCLYTQVSVFNCIIHDVVTSFLRANRGTNGGDYQMDNITVRNSLIYNVANGNTYTFLHLDKLQFNTLYFSQNTMYSIGRQLITASTTLVTPPPNITFDYCTINSIGASNLYLAEASANPVRFNFTNSIIANVPKPNGTTAGTVHYTATTSTCVWNNNDYFNFTNGSGVALTFPTTNITMIGNQTINLGWTATTTDFTLPATSPLRTASNVSTPIGDPKWTY